MADETPTAPAPMTPAEHDAQVLDPSSALMNPLHPHHAVAKAQADAQHGGPALSDVQAIQTRIAALEGDGLEGLQGPAWNERHPQHKAVSEELARLYRELGEQTAAQQAAKSAPVEDDPDLQLGDLDRVRAEWGPTVTLDEAAPPELWPAGAWDTDTAAALHQRAAEAGLAGPALAVHEAIGRAVARGRTYSEEEGEQLLRERVGADAEAVWNLGLEALNHFTAPSSKVRQDLIARGVLDDPDVVLALSRMGYLLRQRGVK